MATTVATFATQLATENEDYLLQESVLFDLQPGLITIGRIRNRWEKVLLEKRDRTRGEIIASLQKRAEVLGHHVDVAEILARAQA